MHLFGKPYRWSKGQTQQTKIQNETDTVMVIPWKAGQRDTTVIDIIVIIILIIIINVVDIYIHARLMRACKCKPT